MLPWPAGDAECRVASPYVRVFVPLGMMHSAAQAGDPFRCFEYVHLAPVAGDPGEDAGRRGSSTWAQRVGTNRA